MTLLRALRIWGKYCLGQAQWHLSGQARAYKKLTQQVDELVAQAQAARWDTARLGAEIDALYVREGVKA